jgi:protein-disulfide isomerase
MEESTKGKEDKESERLKDFTSKLKKNPWMMATLALGVVCLILVIMALKPGVTGNVALSPEEAGTALVGYLNTVVGGGVSYVSNQDLGSLYEITVNYKNESIPVYVTKDGKYFVQGATPITGQAVQQQQQEQPKDVPKSDKPKVELFVMSFCPYGVKAENNIMPVLELLKDKIDFNVRYIVSVSGTTIDTAQSLHGLTEAKQDAVQLIIKKNYASKFLAYLTAFNANCYPLGYSDTAKADSCWKAEAVKLGMDTNKIETAAYGTEGIGLLKAEEAIDGQYGVSGSPTLIINGVQSSAIYSGTTATQTAICDAFNNEPSECGTAVAADNSTAPSGSCG